MINRKSTTMLAAGVTAALIAGGATAASGTPNAPSKLIPTPHLTINASKGSFHVKGPRHFSAGRVDLTLHAKKGEQEFFVAQLHKGYSVAQAGADFGTFFAAEQPTPEAMKALHRLVRNITFYGGLDSGTGHKTVSGSITLPKAGRYLVIDDAQTTAAPVTLHVSKRVGNRVTPTSTAVAKATSAKRWKGSRTLPATGTITFKNAATNSPHFLNLQHVKKGTTRRDVIKALTSDGPPTIFANGTLGTDVLNPGKSMTLSYSLPKGTYAEMCFFPDLKTGMPHAMMGMVRIVKLK